VGERVVGVTGVLIAIVAIITAAAAFVGYHRGSGNVSVLRSAYISISPMSQSGAAGAKLTYIVTVTNTGNVSDSYSLGVDWGSLSYKISPSILSIKAGDSENATLTVTVGPVSEVMEVYCATDETVLTNALLQQM
jgi:hypothetical protein